MSIDLPPLFEGFFWDYDFRSLSWDSHRDFIIRRILQSGSWEALSWLRAQLGDPALRAWIEAHRGAGLSPRQLRFWELLLDMPHDLVTNWVEVARRSPWERRIAP